MNAFVFQFALFTRLSSVIRGAAPAILHQASLGQPSMKLQKYLIKPDELKALTNQMGGALSFTGKIKGRENKILGIRLSKPTRKSLTPSFPRVLCAFSSFRQILKIQAKRNSPKQTKLNSPQSLHSDSATICDSVQLPVLKWSEVKSLSHVWLFVTPWTVAY